MDRNLIAQCQIDALKLQVLRAYLDFRGGRPTAESVAEKQGIAVRTVPLRLDEEVRAIEQALRQANWRDQFDLR